MSNETQPTVAPTVETVVAPTVEPVVDVVPEQVEETVETAPATPDVTAELVNRLMQEKREANAEAKKRRMHEKELMEQVAKYQKIEEAKAQAEMTELEKVRAELAKKESEIANARAETDKLKREAVATRNGVLPKYAKYVAAELAASNADDEAEWMAEFKSENPAFFVQTVTAPAAVSQPKPATVQTPPAIVQAPAGAGGPPVQQTANVQAKIQSLMAEYQRLSTGSEMYREGAGSERYKIKKQLRQLTGKDTL